MSAPVRSFLAVGTAFAAGIAVTAAFVGGRPERPQVEPAMTAGPSATGQAPKVADLASTSRAAETAPLGKAPAATETWVDPTRQRAAAPAANPPLPPLVFHVERRSEPAKDQAARDGTGADEGDVRRTAVVPPPRRPTASELLAKSGPRREPASETDTADATRESRAPAPKPQAPRQTANAQHKAAGSRVASSDASQDNVRLVAPRQSRQIYVARRDDVDPPSGFYPPRHVEVVDRYERDVEDRPSMVRRRVTAAEAGGVLRWLDHP